MNDIHPTAVISPEAILGDNIHVGPYSIIEKDCSIGDGCWIDSHVKIAQYTTLGKRCRIYLGALVGEEPQDHRFKVGTVAHTILGDDVTIREYVTIHRSPFEGGLTTVGDGTLLMSFVHIGHDARLGRYVTIANHTAISGHIIVEDYAVISGYILAHQFCRVGSLAMVAGGARIVQDVPPFCMVDVDSCICGPNTVGLRRANFSSDLRIKIRKAIKTFFFKGMNTTNALAEIESEGALEPEIQHFVDFIRKSERGILAGKPELKEISAAKED